MANRVSAGKWFRTGRLFLLILGASEAGMGCSVDSRQVTVADGGTGGDNGGSGGATGSGSGGTSGGGSGGATGSGGTGSGGVSGSGGALTPVDGGGPGDSGLGDPDASLPPLEECKTPSIDRIQSFSASGEGTTVPMNGTLLVKQGAVYVAKEQFVGNEWHVMEVLIGNSFSNDIDLSTSKTFTMTYSSTADLWIQMRPGFHYSGGAQWVIKIPSSNGQTQRQTFSLDATAWGTISLGKPTWTYEMAIKQVRGFVVVGDKPNTIVISGLRFDNYTPVCR